MIQAGLSGRLVEARRNAVALLPLVCSLFAEPSPAIIKAVLHREGRISTPDVRMPLSVASPDGMRNAVAAFEALRQ
jgi:4-hydroxy-tetrahydrodipicolinate synthase